MSVVLAFAACGNATSTSDTAPGTSDTAAIAIPGPDKIAADTLPNAFDRFLPKGYVIFDTLSGELNKDGLNDCILIIKGTDKSKVVTDEYRGELDRNRRGIIVLFGGTEGYEVASKNYECFSSENEDGGAYFPADLYIETENGNLYLRYLHGRYGYWTYTFRFQNSDFELIGYDASSSNGPVVSHSTSINYMTNRKTEKENTNESAEPGEEYFKETTTKISASPLLKLSAIKDFDELEVPGE